MMIQWWHALILMNVQQVQTNVIQMRTATTNWAVTIAGVVMNSMEMD